MKSTVEIWGRAYDASSDFKRIIDEATEPGLFGPEWMRQDIPRDWALAEWGQEFVGSSLVFIVGEIALELMETAPLERAQHASSLPFEYADRAAQRVAHLAVTAPERFGEEPRSVSSCLWKVLQRYPRDPDVTAVVRVEAKKPDADPLMLSLAKQLGVGGS